jgi:hypothetical protein
MNPPCRHGVPDGASTAEKRRIVEECDRRLNEIDDVNQRVGAFFDFWCHPSRSHVVSKELAALYFATATDALLDDGPNTSSMEDFSYIETTYGIDILEMAEKGVDRFIQDLRQNGQSHENSEIVRQIGTRDGLLRYLSKAIPCTCLDSPEQQEQEQKDASQEDQEQDGNVALLVTVKQCEIA